MKKKSSKKAIKRVLEFIRDSGAVKCSSFEDGDRPKFLLEKLKNNSTKLLCQKSVFEDINKRCLVEEKENRWRLSKSGGSWLKRNSALPDIDTNKAFQNQHRRLERRNIKIGEETQTVVVNGHESPLYRLRTRKTSSGEPWLSEPAFVAGERLRSDFTRSQGLPNVTSNWEGYSIPKVKTSGSGGKTNLSDHALDAKKRVESALGFVGPELAGVLTDVCCFLKGLETVERERRWPPRSAKLMLRTGLDLLARYYGTATGNGVAGSGIVSWGSEGYRPSISE